MTDSSDATQRAALNKPASVSGRHVPVLLREVIAVLSPQVGDTAVDCTAGLGGHAQAVAEHIGPGGTMVLFDLDPANLSASRMRLEGLSSPPRIVAVHASYHEAARRLVERGLSANCVLADLGFASNQVDSPERGLSFSKDGPLDMRLDPTSPITAKELVNTLSARELSRILKDWGEERNADSIAQKIVQERTYKPIETTAQLAEIARAVAARWHGPRSWIDPATKTFQALRIAVNDELGRLESLLESVEWAAKVLAKRKAAGANCADVAQERPASWLAIGARVGIISFHSLEDRPVKQTFASMAEQGLATSLTRKPIEATDDERSLNTRARSAKLRACRVGT